MKCFCTAMTSENRTDSLLQLFFTVRLSEGEIHVFIQPRGEIHKLATGLD